MRRNRIACHAITWKWVNGKLADVLESIAGLGFDGIELPSEFFLSAESSSDAIKLLLEKRNILIISVYQTARLGISDDFLRQYEVEKCKALLNFIHAFGIKYLIVGDPPAGFCDSHVALAESLEMLGSIAKSKGVSLCYHPHRGSIIETPEQIDSLLKLTSRDNVSLCLDTGHIYWGGGNPSQVLRRFKDRVGYVHFKDVRKKPLSVFEKLAELISSIGAKVDGGTKLKCLGFMLLETKGPIITETGRGDIDFLSVVKELDNIGYEGWITIELDTPTLVPELAMSRCLSHVDGLFKGEPNKPPIHGESIEQNWRKGTPE